MNKNEPPFLAIDYRILALDIKTDVNEKTIDSSTILKLKLVYCYPKNAVKFIQNKQKWVKHWVLVPDKLLGDVSRYLSRWDGFQKHRETEHQIYTR
ncbi:hypothetical protein [Klebsiella pneumoniae]|uniref:hypothetical protein n=1 Tax=Klebsiella pneumoniae TaxID=573 RepID=UPI001124E1BE|nr:hypothetical protein [Klebsiella pneumoniae]